MCMHCFVKNLEKKASTLNFQKYLIEATQRNLCRFFYARKFVGTIHTKIMLKIPTNIMILHTRLKKAKSRFLSAQ